jgi:glutamate synthase domain-containing protein 2/glutamate synthase domain-containing protein 1/glutamate synthase domain-containing protein 3
LAGDAPRVQLSRNRRAEIRAGKPFAEPTLRLTAEQQSRRRHRAHGLYDPHFESDACGVGFIADVQGRVSHETVSRGLEILNNLTHRGAAGADEKTGDGAGILMQMPDAFLRGVAGFGLPAAGEYGVAMLFLCADEIRRRDVERIIATTIRGRGMSVLGWRDVPVDSSVIGRIASEKEPITRQLFIGRGAVEGDRADFERALYVARKAIERAAVAEGHLVPEDLYVVSMSCNTLIYKGLFLADQVAAYYPDLRDERMASALALVHQRFSTNTFPEWDLAHPFRYLAHNGEINTLQGNVNWMRAREAQLASPLFSKKDLRQLSPVIREGASDSACFDNVLELLVQGGRDLPHAVMMMIPEAWEQDPLMSADKRAFYEYHAAIMEPWDGPAALAFTNGRQIGATLDRNGLRPARWIHTTDGLVVMASEFGVLDIPDSKIRLRGRLQPGRIFLVDQDQQRVVGDEEIKTRAAARRPYAQWIAEQKISLDRLPAPRDLTPLDLDDVLLRQKIFGYSVEDLKILIGPMAVEGKEPIGSMGTDTPLAVLSNRPKPLYNYFKQHFAQVSNPPIDSIREENVMSLVSYIGAELNLFGETPEHAHLLELDHPILTNAELAKFREFDEGDFQPRTLSMVWNPGEGETGLERALLRLCAEAEAAVRGDTTVLILSDREVSADRAPIPALLATAAVHHHLIRAGIRKRCGIVVESGEPREIQHFALLIGYGAHAVNPYLAFESIAAMIEAGDLPGLDREKAVKNFVKAVGKGLLKTFSKMGISTLQSYHGAQIFEAIGLGPELVERWFTGTPSRLGGVDIEALARDSATVHAGAFPQRFAVDPHLEWGGEYQYRAEGEHHAWTPMAIANLQRAVQLGDQAAFDAYVTEVDGAAERLTFIRGLLDFEERPPVPLAEVEPAESILRRFKTGAMSLGSISGEAHETLAIAMNKIGGKSNTGEGGEDERRFVPDADGTLRRSAIKQVASGRFGVTANYLANADEIQIKMAQGAKPGEGGQLPGHKVSAEIAAVRHSTPGVGLISPPPHHDIYSIEDLAQLIFDLKNANPRARINVKLVAEVGVGTIAAGVAKAHADVVLISGHDGGTGASPLSSLKHAGVPWEIGLAEAHQVLIQNGLRSRIVVEADGGLKTGRDVIVAALLGAEEYGFSTSALITMGCIYLRKCHLNTCSVGIATQRPELRKKFAGKPEHVVNFFRFVAEDVRRWLARLGFRSLDEAVGRTDVLKVNRALEHWKASDLDLSPLLAQMPVRDDSERRCTTTQNHGLDKIFDHELIRVAEPALERGEPVRHEFRIRNSNRTTGTMLSYETATRYGSKGLPDETIHYTFRGVSGQSFGAFLSPGIRFDLVGVANDYVGKGLSGGEISVRPPDDAAFVAEENIIVGNVVLYGGVRGRAFFRGQAGERFCVRNSGVHAVVEGVGDHGCEYMTGGRVVVLGKVGRNFAAGMSGGIAYVLHGDRGEFGKLCNKEMVEIESLVNPDEIAEVKALVEAHRDRTGSAVAERVLADWDTAVGNFIKVMPVDYKAVLAGQSTVREY